MFTQSMLVSEEVQKGSALQVEGESRNTLTLCQSNHPWCSNISSLCSVQTMQGSWSGHLHVGEYVCVYVCVSHVMYLCMMLELPDKWFENAQHGRIRLY